MNHHTNKSNQDARFTRRTGLRPARCYKRYMPIGIAMKQYSVVRIKRLKKQFEHSDLSV
ncbi:hypothetical protein SAMN04488540_106190, partial [Ferrimonas sediminum]